MQVPLNQANKIFLHLKLLYCSIKTYKLSTKGLLLNVPLINKWPNSAFFRINCAARLLIIRNIVVRRTVKLNAIKAIKTPVVEVHISNLQKREEWRRKSVLTEVCTGLISGLGIAGYSMALRYFKDE